MNDADFLRSCADKDYLTDADRERLAHMASCFEIETVIEEQRVLHRNGIISRTDAARALLSINGGLINE